MSQFSRIKSKILASKKADGSQASLTDTPSFSCGIKTLFDPPGPLFDVVFVHGLTGDRERTWTSPFNGVCWPRDLLPSSLPDARILTFGYDAYVTRKNGQVAQIDIWHHANDLLNALAAERRSFHEAKRSIIFVAHSLGGILCKDALHISEASAESQLAAIARSTVGMAFVGTPHAGSWLATWAKIPAAIMGYIKRTDVSLLSLLKPDSEVLSRIHNDFLSMLRRRDSEERSIGLACFYETLPMLGSVQIVDQSSATIPGFNNVSVRGNHREIARFSTNQDPGFKSIAGVLDRWTQKESLPTLNDDEEAFLETISFSEMGVRRAVVEAGEPGTCKWLLEDPKYKAWESCQDLDTSHGLLWIKGKPGSGKSTLMKYIASKSAQAEGVVRLVFFFNARGAEEERNAQGLFKTFLHQLMYESPTMRNRLLTHFRKKRVMAGKKNMIAWTSAELRDMFFDTVSFSPDNKVEIFVDALDECNDDEVRQIISSFEKCAATHAGKRLSYPKICWSSRHYPHISIDYGFELKVEAMNSDDIALYVHRQLERSRNEHALHSLGPEIVEKAQGVFLWSVLVVNKLRKLADKGLPLERIQMVIREIPSELGRLYAEIVSTLDPDLAEDTASLLHLVLYATRPLDTDELRLGIEFMRKEYPSTLQQFASLSEQVSHFRLFVTELSGGLLEVVDSGVPAGREYKKTPMLLEDYLGLGEHSGTMVQGISRGIKHDPLPTLVEDAVSIVDHSAPPESIETGYDRSNLGEDIVDNDKTRWIVQVIHETVRDFLKSDDDKILPGQSTALKMSPSVGHLRLYQFCKRILTTDELSCVTSQRRLNKFWGRLPYPQLIDLGSLWLGTTIAKYAIENVLPHLKSSRLYDPKNQSGQLWDTLTDDLRRDVRRVAIADAVWRWDSIRSSSHDPVGRFHPLYGTDLQFDRDSTGYRDMIELVLGPYPGTRVDCIVENHLCLWTSNRRFPYSGGRPLRSTIAATAHHGTVQELQPLLSEWTANWQTKDLGPDPLVMAIRSGSDSIFGFLLDNGLPVDPPREDFKTTPLIEAVEQGHIAFISELLRRGADPNRVGELWATPLATAVRRGMMRVVQILIQNGADCNQHLDRLGETAYDLALQRGFMEIVNFLEPLTNGAGNRKSVSKKARRKNKRSNRVVDVD